MLATIFLVTLHKLMQLGSVNSFKAFINVNKLKMSALKKNLTPNLLFTRVLGRVRRPKDKAVH